MERGLPAISVTIQGRNIDFSGVSGVSDLSSGEQVRQDNRFYVASTGKTILAATLVQMAGDGLLGLDDPIHRWLPLAITDRIPSSEQMSVRMLLNHTTGIYDFQNDGEEWDNDFFLVSGPDRQWTQADALPYFLDKPLHFEPGNDYSYSNSNYILAALVIEAVSGQPVQHAIRQRIIDPLGLTHTLHGDEAIGQAGLVHGYFSEEGERYDSHPLVQPLWSGGRGYPEQQPGSGTLYPRPVDQRSGAQRQHAFRDAGNPPCSAPLPRATAWGSISERSNRAAKRSIHIAARIRVIRQRCSIWRARIR